MRYFDGIAVGDRVWDFIHKWGSVLTVGDDYIYIKFDNESTITYNFEGIQKYTNLPQTLFWDEITFDKPKGKNVTLTEKNYNIVPSQNAILESCSDEFSRLKSFSRDDKETAKQSLSLMIKQSRLLALRDKLCDSSRGFTPAKSQCYFIVVFENGKYIPYDMSDIYIEECVKFRSADDAQMVCNVLNTNRFNISIAGELA